MSTSAPEVTPPPAEGDVITVVVVQTAGCEHTQPGVQSEFLKNVIVTSPAGDPMEGLTVDEQVQGPGLLDESGQITNTLTASATTDTQGEADFVFPIVSFGPYTGVVQRVTLPDGRLAAFDPESVLRTDFTVGETCTPP